MLESFFYRIANMGTLLAKCLPETTRVKITDALPDRDVLMAAVDSIVAFEDKLRGEKQEKAREKRTAKAVKVVQKLRKTM